MIVFIKSRKLIAALLTIITIITCAISANAYTDYSISISITTIESCMKIENAIKQMQHQHQIEQLKQKNRIKDKLNRHTIHTTSTNKTTLYSTTSLNIRKHPNKNSEILATLNPGDTLVQTGICTNGWLRIQYKDEEAYVYATYTTDKQPDINYGTAGRLYINDHSVALYNGCKQSIVDKKDSAATWKWDKVTYIADHWNQGFDTIKTCAIGDTCYIAHKDGTRQTYICTDIDRNGHNKEYDIVDHNGNSVDSYSGLVMYTCNDNWRNITLVYWQPTN